MVTIELGDGRKIGAMEQTYFDHLKMRGEVRYLGFYNWQNEKYKYSKRKV